ncbi:unnamed protein product [[Candida] boidinii]|nr:unnamed protein product [[Candida] boidinii]
MGKGSSPSPSTSPSPSPSPSPIENLVMGKISGRPTEVVVVPQLSGKLSKSCILEGPLAGSHGNPETKSSTKSRKKRQCHLLPTSDERIGRAYVVRPRSASGTLISTHTA